VALKVGDTMEVTFPAAAQDRVKAKVVHVAAVADPASETRRVRLEVPNPGGRPAGERVRVYLP
jgi:multidrug efflux pump subunit AcrA (membrane-fusion protein)